jgi:hypothetical protein
MLTRYPVSNLGQARPACPAVPKSSTLNCQRTPEGGVLCSDGTYFPPGCTNLPPITTPGVAPYVRSPGTISLVAPPPYDLAQETGEGFPYIPVGIAVAGIIFAVVF